MTEKPEKKAFLEKQKAQLQEWSKQVDQLKKMAKKTQIDASVKFDNYVDDLRSKIDDARSRFEALQQAGDKTLEDVRGRVDNIWKDLKETLEKVKSRLG